MENIIKVGMADLKVLKHPGILTTLGLGSCVGIALYDPTTKICGLAHIMLPSRFRNDINQNKAKFADTALDEMLDKMIELGANRSELTAKIAGGAQMFSFTSLSEIMKIGERNIIAVKQKLDELKIPIAAEDTGGNFGRTIELYSQNGNLMVKTIGYGIKTI